MDVTTMEQNDKHLVLVESSNINGYNGIHTWWILKFQPWVICLGIVELNA
jgi:hypothetical protein